MYQIKKHLFLKTISSEQLELHLKNSVEHAKKQLLKIYKLSNLNTVVYDLAIGNDDFIKDTKTQRIELKK